MIRPATTRPPTPPASRPAPVSALPEGLLNRFLGKRVVIRLLFGDEVEGTLSRVDKFELLLTRADGAAVIVFKGGISSVREAPDDEGREAVG